MGTGYILNQAGRAHLKTSLQEALKADLTNMLPETFNRWVEECEATACDRIPGEHEPGYEVRGIYTIDGKPWVISFSDEHFAELEID